MVGPDSVVPSSSAGVQRRRDDDGGDDDDVEYEDSRTVIDAADVDVDIVQLLTRRLSVSPPSDVPFCPRALERRRMTASTSTEVLIYCSLSLSLSLNLPLPSVSFSFSASLSLVSYSIPSGGQGRHELTHTELRSERIPRGRGMFST